MKGFNIVPLGWLARDGSAAEVRAMGGDTIRLMLHMDDGMRYEEQLAAIPEILADCNAHGIDIVFSIMYQLQIYPDVEAEFVKLIAEYDHRKCVIGYDLVNEPWDKGIVYQDYIHGMVKRLRVFTDKTFVVEAGQGSMGQDFTIMKPINDDNIIYSYHMYWPYEFTMQGFGDHPVGISWPGDINGTFRDRDSIVRYDAKYARDFQLKYNVPIVIGELGCSIYSDDVSGNQWLADATSICNEYNWGYFIHTYPYKDFRLPELI